MPGRIFGNVQKYGPFLQDFCRISCRILRFFEKTAFPQHLKYCRGTAGGSGVCFALHVVLRSHWEPRLNNADSCIRMLSPVLCTGVPGSKSD